MEVYKAERAARGNLAPSNYQSRAADVLGARGHGGEELYRLTYIPGPKSLPTHKEEDPVRDSLLLLQYVGLVDEGSANKDMTSLLDEARMAEDEREMVVAEEGEGGGEEEGAVDEKGTGAASAGAGIGGEEEQEGEGSAGAGGGKRGVEDGGGDWEGSKRARNE
ncbi:hypothetical protein Naga_100546g6 [Nannochloropsis gaditana]|uniref:Uncharacterized protein n=1 Tax=Nannochloropsis gaditana TaxID=72520 RepID=W7TQ88_9STRA|nr:hypothetical protein Naga_100546g6 [Nannochloropsis gaditana]